MMSRSGKKSITKIESQIMKINPLHGILGTMNVEENDPAECNNFVTQFPIQHRII